MSSVVLASFDRVPSAKGAARHILQNHDILTRAGHDVALVTLGDAPLPFARHLPILLNEPNYLRRAMQFHARVRGVFEQNEFEVYHVRSPWEGLAVPVGKPLVYEVNGLLSIEAAYHHPAVYSQPELRSKLRHMELALLDRAALVLTPSQITAALLGELGVERERVRVVTNAPVVEITQAPAVREEGCLRVAYLGTLTHWQGLREGLRALARLGRPFLLSIRTPSSDRGRREIMRLAAKLGVQDSVTIADPIEPQALGPWLRAFDVALAPLVACERNVVQGGMPIKILDALASGVAVLAPDLPIAQQLLGPQYPTYRRHSVGDMVALLSRLADSAELREQLGRLGIERVVQHHSPSHQQGALLAAYASIAAVTT